MNFGQFNFENPQWFWLLAWIPVLWAAALYGKSRSGSGSRLRRFADEHLLRLLVRKSASGTKRSRKRLILWSLMWTLGALALAGPRWDFKEVNTFKPNKDLVIALDLSRSMDAQDVKPSRLVRARQEIQDILDHSPDVNIGLVAFAGDAHLITPITEDKGAIRYLLGALRTDLVYLPGNRLGPALALSSQLLNAVPGAEKSLLILSDGEFDDPSSIQAVQAMAARGIRVSTMGFGKTDGPLRLISEAGHGFYVGSPSGVGVLGSRLAQAIGIGSSFERGGKSIRDWEPRFYVFLFPLLLLMLPLFRRKAALRGSAGVRAKAARVAAALLCLPYAAHAGEPGVARYFKNPDTIGKEALGAKDYETATRQFKDPYRRGVAQYRAGQFDQAAQSFAASQRPNVQTDAKYNLGNSLAQLGKYEEAIAAYEGVLKREPGYTPAKTNLKIVQDLLKKKQSDTNRAENQKPGGQGETSAENQKPGGQGEKSAENQKPGGQGEKSAENQKPGGQGEKSAENQKPGGQGEKSTENQKEADLASGQPPQSGQASEKQEVASANPPNGQMNPAGAVGDLPRAPQKRARTPKDVDADQWLNRINSDPHELLKNQFMIESSLSQARKGE